MRFMVTATPESYGSSAPNVAPSAKAVAKMVEGVVAQIRKNKVSPTRS
jgi:hypothetical protein